MSDAADAGYRAGACNIGAPQRARRRRWALGAALVAAGSLAVVAVGPLPRPLVLGVFVPASLAAEWAIESRRAFCVRLAVAGRYAIRNRTGETPTDERPSDLSTALRITAVAALVGAVVSVLAYLGLGAV